MATHPSILTWETPCRGAWWATTAWLTLSLSQCLANKHWHCLAYIILRSEGLSKVCFKNTLFPEVKVWLKPRLCDEAGLIARLRTCWLLCWNWRSSIRGLGDLLELLCRCDIDGPISPTWLSLSWGDAFAYSFGSVLACLENSGTWIGSTFQVMKKEAVTWRRTWHWGDGAFVLMSWCWDYTFLTSRE